MIANDEDAEHDPQAARRRWNAYLADIDAEIREERAAKATFTTDIGKVLEPDIVIKPGSRHANAAAKVGREDEYINRMQAKYGGQW